ncbi:hypothetical protein MRX96_057564 [Rhipicephalus microplus]
MPRSAYAPGKSRTHGRTRWNSPNEHDRHTVQGVGELDILSEPDKQQATTSPLSSSFHRRCSKHPGRSIVIAQGNSLTLLDVEAASSGDILRSCIDVEAIGFLFYDWRMQQ